MGRNRLTAIAIGAVCLLTALYLGVARHDAVLLRDANRLGLAGRFADALTVAERIRHPPADARAQLVEAYALEALARATEASRAFSRAARRDPNNWAIREDWAVLLDELGDRAGARIEYRRARRLNPRLPARLQPRSAPGAQ